MYTYTVTLDNFGSQLYRGTDLATALYKLEHAGFEATMQIDYDDDGRKGQSFRHYSPIRGWY